MPLQNDIPDCDYQKINSTLFYPDSIICTLTVNDLNDTMHSLFSVIAGTVDFDSIVSDTLPWIGHTQYLNRDYTDKQILISLAGSTLGKFNGDLLINDSFGDIYVLPYSVERMFCDSFNMYPLNALYWQKYDDMDSAHVTMDYADLKLMFLFDTSSSATGAAGTGVRSKFAVDGDCKLSVDFSLRDDMFDGFHTDLFLSTSSDTAKYAGRTFGMFLEAGGQWINIKCKSGWQMSSKEIQYYTGTLYIEKVDSTVRFFGKEAKPSSGRVQFAEFSFSDKDPLYVHFKMMVDDRTRIRHCTWDNFCITEGTLVF
ncbi:MAG: hypothetical protein GF401_08545 [Chitinivibrionales bacterium]|nr:hypothetical protein [Chitinivibrionales bacterium]